MNIVSLYPQYLFDLFYLIAYENILWVMKNCYQIRLPEFKQNLECLCIGYNWLKSRVLCEGSNIIYRKGHFEIFWDFKF